MNPVRSTDDTPSRWTLGRGIRQAVILAAVMFASLGLYLAVLKWRGPDASLVTHTALDDLVPFRPEWVWVYLLPYLIGPVLFFFLTPATFRWYIGRGLTVLAVTLLIFVVWPSQTAQRPPATSLGNGITAQIYQSMIAMDEPPGNAAPSLHVSLTCLLALALVRDFPRWWAVTLGGVGLVWLSTLLTRQHHLLDVITGLLLTFAVVTAWAGRGNRSIPAQSPHEKEETAKERMSHD
jgi:membrane-associated phospholipid phosphatase